MTTATKNTLDEFRLNLKIDEIRARLESLDEDKKKELDEGMTVDFQEHFQYQETQAQAHAVGRLTPGAAQIVYNSLGEVHSSTNGGWTENTDLATKIVVTKLMGELLSLKIRGKL